jgi:hypothetical protein
MIDWMRRYGVACESHSIHTGNGNEFSKIYGVLEGSGHIIMRFSPCVT